MTDYRWLAQSIAIAGDRIAEDIAAAIDHAANVPGERLTPAMVDRLTKLADALHEVRSTP